MGFLGPGDTVCAPRRPCSFHAREVVQPEPRLWLLHSLDPGPDGMCLSSGKGKDLGISMLAALLLAGETF